jgi:ABC-type uncharacterized transport system substrate-binding protein
MPACSRSKSSRSRAEVDTAFVSLARKRPGGLIVLVDSVTLSNKETIVEQTRRLKLPAIYQERAFVELGGLMSYALNYCAHMARAAAYVDRILRGDKPSDLPVEQPSSFELVLNLRTAKALGVTMPPMVIAIADQVDRMRRRDFIALLGAGLVPTRFAGAQQSNRIQHICILSNRTADDPEAKGWILALEERLQQLGWIEGHNIHIDVRWGANDPDLDRQYAEELVDLKPDLILAGGTLSTGAIQRITRTITIVFSDVGLF